MVSASLIIRYFLLVLACLSAAAGATAQTDDGRIEVRYRISWGNLDLASAEADWSFGQGRYKMTATSQTLGFTDTLRKYRGTAMLSGRISNGSYTPERLHIASVSRRYEKEAFTIWENETGTIQTNRTPELDLEEVFPLKDAFITGAVDPFSAMLNALTNLAELGTCEGKQRIYDGLRTSALSLHSLGYSSVIKDRPYSYEGEAFVCGIVSTSTSGHRRKASWRQKNPTPEDIKVFIAKVDNDIFIPVRIEARSPLGTVVARLEIPTDEIHNNASNNGEITDTRRE